MTSQTRVLSSWFLASGPVQGGRGVLRGCGLVAGKSLGASLEDDSPAPGSTPTLSAFWSTAMRSYVTCPCHHELSHSIMPSQLGHTGHH